MALKILEKMVREERNKKIKEIIRKIMNEKRKY